MGSKESGLIRSKGRQTLLDVPSDGGRCTEVVWWCKGKGLKGLSSSDPASAPLGGSLIYGWLPSSAFLSQREEG